MTDLVSWFNSAERWYEARAISAIERAYDQEPFGCEIPSLPYKDEQPVLTPSEVAKLKEMEINQMAREWAERVRVK